MTSVVKDFAACIAALAPNESVRTAVAKVSHAGIIAGRYFIRFADGRPSRRAATAKEAACIALNRESN